MHAGKRTWYQDVGLGCGVGVFAVAFCLVVVGIATLVTGHTNPFYTNDMLWIPCIACASAATCLIWTVQDTARCSWKVHAVEEGAAV